MSDICFVCSQPIDGDHTCAFLQIKGQLQVMHSVPCASVWREQERLLKEHPTAHIALVAGCPACAQIAANAR